MSKITIDKRLLDSCHYLGKFEICHVLLNRNALLPWFILVPETEISNLLQLGTDDVNQVMAESKRIYNYLASEMGYTKNNFASLGNVVDQLHIHIVGRSPNDCCWPQPIWGFLDKYEDYSATSVNEITDKLVEKFSLSKASL